MSLSEDISFDKDGNVEPDGFRGLVFRKLFLGLTIILIATLSFGLGRLSVSERKGIELKFDPDLVTEGGEAIQSGAAINSTSMSPAATYKAGEVVTSSKGTKYHYPHCPGAKQISEANRLIFASAEAAEASGYTLAGNCSPR